MFQDLLGDRIKKDESKVRRREKRIGSTLHAALSFPFPFSAPQNASLASLSRKERAKHEDPVKLAVEVWVEGKERNVRALLSSLDQILWEGARWKPVNMAAVREVGVGAARPNGKRKAPCALLCCFLCESRSRLGAFQLMEPAQVRKAYQRACLVVHPDKMTGGEHEPLAREIFIQISQAYERFMENS